MVVGGTKSGLPSASVIGFASVALLISVLHGAAAQSSQTMLTLGSPGVTAETSDTILVAARLNNTSRRTAFNVQIDSIQLDPAFLVLRTKFPMRVGDVAAQQNAMVQVECKINRSIPGKEYSLVIHGTYISANKDDDPHDRQITARHQFTASIAIVLPPASPGSASAHRGGVAPHHVTGAPFAPQPPNFDEQINGSRWTVPGSK
jgi:hypothetical protein